MEHGRYFVHPAERAQSFRRGGRGHDGVGSNAARRVLVCRGGLARRERSSQELHPKMSCESFLFVSVVPLKSFALFLCQAVLPVNRISAKQLLAHSFLTGLPEVEEEVAPAKVEAFAVPKAVASFAAAPPSSSSAEPVVKKHKPEDLKNVVPVCKYGKDCFRKNPQHFAEFAHPWITAEKKGK